MSGGHTGIYPGTFDPTTNGHMDIIQRATRVVDRLIVAVAANAGKDPMFPLDQRVAMVSDEVAALSADNGVQIEVVPFDTLLMDFGFGAGSVRCLVKITAEVSPSNGVWPVAI